MLHRRTNLNKTRRLGAASRKFIYAKKTYSNPFFHHKRQNITSAVRSSTKSKLIVFSAIIIIIILGWLLFFSNLLKINNIVITGVDGSTAKQIEDLVRNQTGEGLITSNNLLILSKKELTEALNDKYYLANISIKKRFLHTLIIDIIQKQQAAVWLEDEIYYYLDNQGNIINQVDPLNIDRAAYPLIENLTNIKINDRKADINPETINYILNLFNEFANKKHNFEITKFIVDQDINTVKMAILDGPQIYFNTTLPAEAQISKLDLIIKETLKDTFKTKQYIDLRYNNNIYIK